ncbi:MAG: AbrB/MazE/SpoVT family DNA-binding domain-containing protein [Firmicutes bacterium]|nr:AbrB/MazE/SpoVT family DNA-binding domain-containing protein [Bacillota bacterium]
MKKVKEAILSAKCQITVPKEVRKRLGIDSGDAIAFYFDGDDIKIVGTNNLEVLPKEKNKAGTVKGEKQNG